MFCTKCGTKIEDNETVCYGCGCDIEPRLRQELQQPQVINKLYNKKLIGGLLLVLFIVSAYLVGLRYYEMHKYDVVVRRIEITQFPLLCMEVKIDGELEDILEPENFTIEENGNSVNLVNFKPITTNRYLVEFAPDNFEQGGEIVDVNVTVKINGIKHKENVQYETPRNIPQWHTT